MNREAQAARADGLEAEVRHACRRRMERIRARELDEMVDEFYADDAVLLPAGREAVRGIHAIREFWRETPKTGLVSLSLESSRVEGEAGFAWEAGTFSRTLRPRHGAPFQDHGKYLVVYRREANGELRAVAEMFNSDR